MGKAETLRAFLGQLPPAAARKLLDAVERGDLPAKQLGLSAEELHDCLAEQASLSSDKRDSSEEIRRLFVQPFEDLLFEGDRKEKEPGMIPRTSIEPIWSWLKEDLLPDTIPGLLSRIDTHIQSGDEIARDAAMRVMHESAGSAMTAALEQSEIDPGLFDALVARLGGYDLLEDAREIADVFMILDEMMEMQRTVPRHIAAFDTQMVAEVRDLYDTLYEKDPDRAIYLALAVMGRLESPWHILRLARKVAQKDDDTMISRTDFSILGERLIRRLEIISSYFQKLRPGLSDLDELHRLLVEFSELSKGITKEIELLRIGNWGQRLLKARNVISTAIGDELSRYAKDLGAALPLQRVGGFGRAGPRRADVHHLPDEEKADRARRELTFMKGIRPLAQAIGAQNAFDKVRPELEAYMVSYEDAIIEELRYTDPEAAANAEAYLDLACELTDLLSGDNAASILRKRGRVALQATA